jgi:hypothetical protein
MSHKTLFVDESTTLEDIWGAAVYAYRINGDTYISASQQSNDYSKTKRTNATIAKEVLFNKSRIKPCDKKVGMEMREHFQGLLFKQLSGKISEFEHAMLKIAEKNSVDEWKTSKYEFSLLCSMVRSFEKDKVKQRYYDTSVHFGEVGDRMYLEATVIDSVFSHNWHTNYVTAVTSDKNLVLFTHSQKMDANQKIKIRGTVKSHRDGNITQLNRVKII